MTSLDLMSASAKRRAAITAGLRLWLKIYLCVGLAMSVVWCLSWWDCSQAAQRRAYMEAQYEPIKRIKADTKQTEDKIAQLLEQERVVLSLAAEQPTGPLLGVFGQAAESSKRRVYIKHFNVSHQDGIATGSDASCTVNLRGVGRDDTAIAEFVEHLRQRGCFTEVELKTTTSSRIGQVAVREFQLECSL